MPELEDSQYWQRNFERNQAFLKPGQHSYATELTPAEEQQFQAWVMVSKIPFDPKSQISDYDMRGFWKAMQQGNPIAMSAVDPNDQRLHYPDYWKTPYSATFSSESQWANPAVAPRWQEDNYMLCRMVQSFGMTKHRNGLARMLLGLRLLRRR